MYQQAQRRSSTLYQQCAAVVRAYHLMANHIIITDNAVSSCHQRLFRCCVTRCFKVVACCDAHCLLFADAALPGSIYMTCDKLYSNITASLQQAYTKAAVLMCASNFHCLPYVDCVSDVCSLKRAFVNANKKTGLCFAIYTCTTVVHTPSLVYHQI
jgi:hypothetical protein